MIQGDEFAARKLVNDVVGIGRKHAGTAYPNPSRTGCPNAGTLKSMANRNRRTALQEMPISHIVSCSPCFNEYIRYRRAAVAFRRLQWAAAIVLITAAALTTTRLVHFRSSGQRPGTAEKKHATPAEGPPSSAIARLEPPSQVEVNLALFSTTRGEGSGKTQQPIHLPAKMLHVLILLPTGMEPGKYEVRLQDTTGAMKLQREVTVSLSGSVASFTLDLKLEPSDSGRRWRLMIREPGLSWRSYPVAIG